MTSMFEGPHPQKKAQTPIKTRVMKGFKVYNICIPGNSAGDPFGIVK